MNAAIAPPDAYKESGQFFLAIDSVLYTVPLYCPHRAGRLDHGHVNARRRTVTCPLHYSTFCLRTGRQLSGPECGSLSMIAQPRTVLAENVNETSDSNAQEEFLNALP